MFAMLVRQGGEVDANGLADRIAAARLLAFCRDIGDPIGIAAIKNPKMSYRDKVSGQSGVALPMDEWPSELGWVFVTPWARKAGVAKALLDALLAETHGGIFATSRTDNVGMQALLRHFGFVAAGQPYPSERPKQQIQLYLRRKPSAGATKAR